MPGYHHYYSPFGAGQQIRQVANVNIGDSTLGSLAQYYSGPSLRKSGDTLDPSVIDVDEENPTPNPKQKTVANDNDHAEPPNPTISVVVKVINPEGS